MNKSIPNSLSSLDETFENYFVKKAPALPQDIKEVIVKFGPWITLVLGLMSIPVILPLIGLGAVLSPVAAMMGARYGMTYNISLVLTLISTVLMFISIPNLLKRSMAGWNMLFYSVLVGFLASLFSYNFLGALISGVISLYILYQIKSMYK